MLTIIYMKTLEQLKDIAQGYKRLNTKDKNLIWLSQRRLRHCKTCTLFSDHGSCDSKKSGLNIKTGKLVNGCGCYMPAKTKLTKAVCPLGKW